MHQDKQLIYRLGGVVKVATRLGFDPKKGGASVFRTGRVVALPLLSNEITRGLPKSEA